MDNKRQTRILFTRIIEMTKNKEIILWIREKIKNNNPLFNKQVISD